MSDDILEVFMKTKIFPIILCLVIISLTLFSAGCNSKMGSESYKKPEIVAVSNGFVLLKYPNSKFYVIDLHTQEANAIRGLSQAGN
jgi:hypothetical protein